MSIACCGQTATQAPQPMHLEATIDGRDMAAAMAFSEQAKRQETQTTDCQARQLASFNRASPRSGRESTETVTSSIGQASAQAPHQVQAPAEKSSQGTPPKA